MDEARVLVAVRDRELGDAVVGHIRAADEAWEVVARHGRQGLASHVQRLRPEAVVLDLVFGEPDVRMGALAALRANLAGDVPGILAVARGMQGGMQCNAAALGADACIREEVLTRESLQANVRWLLSLRRRSEPTLGRGASVLISRSACQVSIGSETFALTPPQLEVLWALASRAPDVVPARELVTGYGNATDDEVKQVVQRYVSRIRRRLGHHAGLIRTVRGRGYQFAATAALVA